jgi:hypothetical protein
MYGVWRPCAGPSKFKTSPCVKAYTIARDEIQEGTPRITGAVKVACLLNPEV